MIPNHTNWYNCTLSNHEWYKKENILKIETRRNTKACVFSEGKLAVLGYLKRWFNVLYRWEIRWSLKVNFHLKAEWLEKMPKLGLVSAAKTNLFACLDFQFGISLIIFFFLFESAWWMPFSIYRRGWKLRLLLLARKKTSHQLQLTRKVTCSFLMSRHYRCYSSSCRFAKECLNECWSLRVSYLHISQSFHVLFLLSTFSFFHRLFFPCGQKKEFATKTRLLRRRFSIPKRETNPFWIQKAFS